MSAFGVVLATGSQNTPLGAGLLECLIEVRVEQSLDEPTKFGIRVREDISGGEPVAANSPELRVETIVTIAVPRDDGLFCLARGPITEAQSQYTLGGPGSWYEVHGADRRVELGRRCYQYAWEGKASDAARQILSGSGFTTDVQDTSRTYGRSSQTLNQRATDLDFLKTIARENGYFLWITYDAQRAGFGGVAAGPLTVTETAHFRTSPYRSLGAGGVPPSIANIALAPTVSPTIRAGAGGDCANNVTSFEVREEVERPNSASASGVDDASVRSESTSASDPQSAVGSGGERLTDVTGLERTLCVTAAGTAEDARGRAEAALADAGWFVTARASTTAHMLGGVLQPHDVVTVEGAGPRHSGPYRVKKVTHVITAADHYMDLELQSNARNSSGGSRP